MPLFNPPPLLQTQFTNQSSDTSTTSTSYVDLLSLTVETGGNSHLLVHFHATAHPSTDNQSISFQLVIDGVVKCGCNTHADKSGGGDTQASASLVWKETDIASGSHTVKIQWKTSTGTASIRPASFDNESALFLASEVFV